MAQARIDVKLPDRGMLDEIRRCAAAQGISATEWARRALHASLARGEGDYRFAEVQVQPRAGGDVAQLLELIMARRPRVGDLVRGDGHLDAGVARAIRAELTPLIAERVIQVFTGARTLEAAGMEQSVSKQAVHQSLDRAYRKLARSPVFIGALLAAVPDSGLTVAQLLEVADVRGRTENAAGRSRRAGPGHARRARSRR